MSVALASVATLTPVIKKGAGPVQTSRIGFAKVIVGFLLIVNLIWPTASGVQGAFAGAVILSITNPLSISAGLGVYVGVSLFTLIKVPLPPDDQVTVPLKLVALAVPKGIV